MRYCLSDVLRGYAHFVRTGQYSESPYINIPFFQTRMDPSDIKQDIQDGPPSLYNDPDKKDRLKNKEDLRRQGPRPGPTDPLIRVQPVLVTEVGDPKTDEQGEPHDNTTPGANPEDLNRETIGFNPGEWEREDVGHSREQRAQYRDTQNSRF